jgi:hypothetical protein
MYVSVREDLQILLTIMHFEGSHSTVLYLICIDIHIHILRPNGSLDDAVGTYYGTFVAIYNTKMLIPGGRQESEQLSGELMGERKITHV